MRKIAVILTLLFGFFDSIMAFSDEDDKNIVNKFYDNVRIIAEGYYPSGQQTEDFVVAKNNALALCYSNSINLPNEFADFNFYTNDPFLGASIYIKRLFDFTIAKKPTIKTEVVKVQALEEIKSTKKDTLNRYPYP